MINTKVFLHKRKDALHVMLHVVELSEKAEFIKGMEKNSITSASIELVL